MQSMGLSTSGIHSSYENLCKVAFKYWISKLEEGEGSQALIFVKLEKKKRPFAPSQPTTLGPNNFWKATPAAEIVTAQL